MVNLISKVSPFTHSIRRLYACRFSSAGVKDKNQDAFAAYQPTSDITQYKGIGACIADGVSFNQNAQHASTTSVIHFLTDYYSTPDSWKVKTAVSHVLSSLNAWLYHHGQQASAHHHGLVTTFSGMILKSNTLHVFHVGDSRIIRLRGKTLEPLTRDHTHHYNNGQDYLSRALGLDSNLDIDYSTSDIKAGDILIATTDGVHGFINNAEIRALLTPLQTNAAATLTDIERIAQQFVDLALSNNSTDNVTCFILRVDNVPDKNHEEAHSELITRAIPPLLTPGQSIDHYLVERKIYSSPHSHLYKVVDQRHHKHYVLKAPSLNFADDVNYLERFVREQWVGSRFDHVNIMHILAPQPDGHFLYHICEAIEGDNLRQWINDHPKATLHEVRLIIEPFIDALRVFKRAGMLHRNLKPENIMIKPSGEVKLIDFSNVSVGGLPDINGPFKEDMPVGSAHYTAPESIIDGISMMQSDQYSLAVIIYEMLTQTWPYRLKNAHRKGANSIDQWEYQSFKAHRPDLPRWLDLALEKACHPNYNHRYEAYSEFWHDLIKPNADLLHDFNRRPLLQQQSSKVWQLISIMLIVVVLIQAYFLI